MSKLLESRKDIRTAIVVPTIGLEIGQENLGPYYRKGTVVYSCCREGTYGQVLAIINDAIGKKKMAEYITWPNKTIVAFCGPVMNFQNDEAYALDWKKYNNMGIIQYNMSAEAMQRRAYILHRLASTRQPESPVLTDVMRAAILPLVRYFCGKEAILPEGLNISLTTEGSESRMAYLMQITGLTNAYTAHHVTYSLIQGAIRAAYELWIEGRFLALRNNTERAVELSKKDELTADDMAELLKMIEDFAEMLSKKKFKEAPKSYPIFPEVTKYFPAIRMEVIENLKQSRSVPGSGLYNKAGFFSWLYHNKLEDYKEILSSCKGDRDHNGSKFTVTGDYYTSSTERAVPIWRYNLGLASTVIPALTPPVVVPVAAPAVVAAPAYQWEAVDTTGRIY